MTRATWCAPLLVTACALLPACAQGIREAPASVVVEIPGATFMMGTSDTCSDTACIADRLPHPVSVSSFRIDATEVTLLQYTVCAAVPSAGHAQPACTSAGDWDYGLRNRPITVTVDQARVYCAAKGGRLPTEAEWELAARSTKGSSFQTYPWGDAMVDCTQVVTGGCPGIVVTADVGTNTTDVTPLGVEDMGANVPEWVEDDYTPAPGCEAETAYSTVCSGDAVCAENRCAIDGSNCRQGCAPGTTTPGASYCEVATTPVVEPYHTTRVPSPLYKGGGITLPECACEAGARGAFDLRPVAVQPAVGFRCAYDLPGKPSPQRHGTARLALPEIDDCSTLTATILDGSSLSADQIAALEFSFESVRGSVPGALSGNVSSFPSCAGEFPSSLLAVGNVPPVAFQLQLDVVNGAGTPLRAVVAVDLSMGEAPLAMPDATVTFGASQ